MRAVVTGSAGFLGRHFTTVLLDRGYDVECWDIREGQDAHDLFRSGGAVFDLVVHCAALEPHRAAIDGMAGHLAANLHLDAAMFEWAVRTGQRRVLYLSSSAAYPVALQAGSRRELHENDVDLAAAEEPDAGYGWAKLTGERMAADAVKTGLPVHVVRPFSGYGEDQDERFPFGAFLNRAKRRDDPFIIWGDGTQVRDWLHVDDLVAGALAVVDADERRPVNLCTGVGTSVGELAELMCKQAGYSPQFEFRLDAPSGVAYRVGDPTRMRDIYQPRISLDDGVQRALTD